MKNDLSEVVKMDQDTRKIVRASSRLMVIGIIMLVNHILIGREIIATPLSIDGMFAIFLVSIVVGLAIHRPIISLQNWIIFTLTLRPGALANQFTEALNTLKQRIREIDEDLEDYKYSSYDFVLSSRKIIAAFDITGLESIIDNLRKRNFKKLPMQKGRESEYFMGLIDAYQDALISILNGLEDIRGDRMQTLAILAAIQETMHQIDDDSMILRDQTARQYDRLLRATQQDFAIIRSNSGPERSNHLDWTQARQRMEGHANRLMNILNVQELKSVRDYINKRIAETSNTILELYAVSPHDEKSSDKRAYLSMKEGVKRLKAGLNQAESEQNINIILLLATIIHAESWCDTSISFDLENLTEQEKKNPA